ncbi:MAG: tetratricopeptide repeat protein [Thermoanaerobaculia bacterium]
MTEHRPTSHRSGPRQASVGRRSLAVLPLRNAGADPAQEYLADGITESLIRQLSATPWLRVLARASVFRLKGRDAEPQTVRRELGVEAMLSGELRVRGEHIELAVELVDCAAGTRLWEARYELGVAELPRIEAEITRGVGRSLPGEPADEAADAPALSPRVDARAYRLYLRGRYLWNQRSEASLDRARAFFEQALTLDSGYALAWSGIADTWNVQPFWGIRPPLEAFPRAQEAVRRALELDPELPEAHAALGYSRFFFDWDWPAAARSFGRALELAPNLAVAHHRLGVALALIGDADDAVDAMDRALQLDPLSLIIQADLGLVDLLGGRPKRAEAHCRAALELAPDFAPAHYYLGLTLERLGRPDEAVDSFLRAEGLAGGAGWALAAAGYAWAASGRTAEARRVLQRLEAFRDTYYVPEYAVAVVHVGLGDLEAALDWLERGIAQRCERMVWLPQDPRMAPLADDPRFAQVRAALPQTSS